MARNPSRSRGESAANAAHLGGRVPPHDLEAEKAVLSALLLDNAAIHAVYIELKPDDFYHPVHRQLYAAMLALTQENQPVDLHTLSDWLTVQKQLDAIGGTVFLAEIADYEATSANVLHHARIVRDKSIKRRLIATATEIVELGFDEGDRADRLLDQAESRIFEISSQNARATFRPLHDEMQRTFDYVDAHHGSRRRAHRACPPATSSSTTMTGGLQPGELIILAARPSMGKTALALNIARNAAVAAPEEGGGVLARNDHARAGDAPALLRGARSTSRSSAPATSPATSTGSCRTPRAGSRTRDLWIDDSGSVTVLEMRAKCRRMKAERGLDLVVIDYLQLAHADLRTRAARAGDLRDQPRAQGAREGARHPGDRALAAEPRAREPPRQATSARCSPTCASPARSSRTPT